MYQSEKSLLIVFRSMPTKRFHLERKDQRIDPNYYTINDYWRTKKCEVLIQRMENDCKFVRPYSSNVEAATVIADEADAGEYVHAFLPPFPAATTTGIPAFVALSTALFNSIAFRSVPRDMLTTIGTLGSFFFR